jgi:hypothetical protein
MTAGFLVEAFPSSESDEFLYFWQERWLASNKHLNQEPYMLS